MHEQLQEILEWAAGKGMAVEELTWTVDEALEIPSKNVGDEQRHGRSANSRLESGRLKKDTSC